ncbi:MAG: AI-2E family transporter [Clostridia bacterium]|nr:AI-2E family transporter [Clostridia bacterium]
MEFIVQLFRRDTPRRFIILVSFGLLLYLMRDMLNMFLLTFIFTYLAYSCQNFIMVKLRKIIPVKQKVLVVVLYLGLLAVIGYVLYRYIPLIIFESNAVLKQVTDFYKKPHTHPVEQYLVSLINEINIASYMDKGADFLLKSITSIGKWGFNIFIALILSLFFLLEKSRIVRFTAKFKTSKISVVYNELHYFGSKFLHTFGKVIQAQIMISFINSILSVIALGVMGFPQLLGLWAMIFILGLIPVAGVMISLVPLTMIAFSIGGLIKVVYVLIMIAVLHALESYLLNPKLMSSKTELPVFYTFLILIVSEHFIGVWGLIIGIPIFMFMLDLINVNSSEHKIPQ